MSFDFGGFLGGIAGTIGAYGVAMLTFRHEAKRNLPSQIRKQLTVGFKIYNTILFFLRDLSHDNLITEEVFEEIQEDLLEPIEKLLPDAIEASGRISEIIIELHNQIDELIEQSFGKTAEDFIEVMESSTSGNQMRQAVKDIVEDYLPIIREENYRLLGLRKK